MANELRALRPTVYTGILFFLYALVVIPLGKYALARWQVPGLSQLAASI